MEKNVKELLPCCPFCGGIAHKPGSRVDTVFCGDCGAEVSADKWSNSLWAKEVETLKDMESFYKAELENEREKVVDLKAALHSAEERIKDSGRIISNQDNAVYEAKYDRDVWYNAYRESKQQLSLAKDALEKISQDIEFSHNIHLGTPVFVRKVWYVECAKEALEKLKK